MKKKIFAFFLILLTIVNLISGININTVKAAGNQFTLGLKYGFSNSLEQNTKAPFYITVTNNGKDFEGYIRVLLPDGSGNDGSNIMWQKEINIPAGLSKQVTIVAESGASTNKVGIQFVNKKGKVVEAQTMDLTFTNSRSYARVGVLSDDYNSLSYLAGAQFTGYPGIKIVLEKLAVNSISEDFGGLDMLDAIIVADYSTDVLSEKQKKVIEKWVEAGGVLVLAGGSTAGKTLSGFSDFNITVSDLTKKKTDFGAGNIDFAYDYTSAMYDVDDKNLYDQAEMDTLYSQIDWSKYDDDEILSLIDANAVEPGDETRYYSDSQHFIRIGKFAENLYKDYSAQFESNFWYSYFGDTKAQMLNYDYYKVYGIEEAENEFADYCKGRIFYILIYTRIAEISVNNQENKYLSAEQYDADIRTTTFGETYINAEDYDFARIKNYGQGNIVVLATDITKEPFNGSANEQAVMVHIFEDLCGVSISGKINAYSGYSSYDWTNDTIQEYAASQKPVPILIYSFVLLFYCLFVLLVYNRLKKQKKTINYWGFLCAAAGITAVVIFGLSYTTRIIGVTSRSYRVVDLNDKDYTSEKIYTTVILPKNKQYTLVYDDDLSLNYVTRSRYYSSNGMQVWDPDYSTFKLGYNSSGDDNEIILGKGSTLEVSKFKSETTYKKTKDVVFENVNFDKATGKLSGTVTNNYGCDIKSATVVYDGTVLFIGDLNEGETVELTNGTVTFLNTFGYNMESKREEIMFGVNEQGIKGALGLSFKSTLCRNVAKMVADDLLGQSGIRYLFYDWYQSTNYYNNGFTANGVPMTLTEKPMFFGYTTQGDSIFSKINEINTEVLYKYIEYSEN